MKTLVLNPHESMDPEIPVTVRHTSPMPHVNGVLPPSVLYLHMPSKFARDALLYATYIAHYFCNRQYMYQNNHFAYYTCHIVDDGTLFVSLEGKEYAVSKGGIFFHDTKKPQLIYTKGEMTMRHISFSGPQAAILCESVFSGRGNIIEKYDHLVVDNAFNTILALAANSSQNESKISAQIHIILGELLAPDIGSLDPVSQVVARAISFMENRFLDDISIKDIADAAYYSENQFRRIFEGATHFTPHAYLRKLRITYAEELLLSTNMTIEDIAEKCGFDNTTTFIRSFKQLCGCAPGQYRKKKKASEL